MELLNALAKAIEKTKKASMLDKAQWAELALDIAVEVLREQEKRIAVLEQKLGAGQ